jgi:DNA-binding MarR family transcriptional regulator
LVESLASNVDARERVITLTAAGEQTIEHALPLWPKAQDSVEQRLGAERVALLRELLHALDALHTRGDFCRADAGMYPQMGSQSS